MPESIRAFASKSDRIKNTDLFESARAFASESVRVKIPISPNRPARLRPNRIELQNTESSESVRTFAPKSERIGKTNSPAPLKIAEMEMIWWNRYFLFVPIWAQMSGPIRANRYPRSFRFGSKFAGRFEQIGPNRSPRFGRDVRSDSDAVYFILRFQPPPHTVGVFRGHPQL